MALQPKDSCHGKSSPEYFSLVTGDEKVYPGRIDLSSHVEDFYIFWSWAEEGKLQLSLDQEGI